MLTIKKRSEKRRLYYYGSAAFVLGFAGVMSYLVQSNAILSPFVAYVPPQIDQRVAPTQQNDEKESETTQADDTANTDSTNAQTEPAYTNPAPVQPASQPVVAQPAQTEPSEPVDPATPLEPSEPVDPTTPPETDEPGILDPIIDIVTP